jgi:urease accessory protein
MATRVALAVVQGRRARSSRIHVLRSQAPLMLRPANPKGPEPLVHQARGAARVHLAASAAGPLGGDDYRFDVHVGAHSSLVLNSVAAMLVLPGARGGRSRMRINVRVEAGATFVWLPEPTIAAQDCDHDQDVRIQLAAGARMVTREEILLGRHREPPGNFRTTLRMAYAGRPIYHQQLRFGPEAEGWDSAAVAHDNHAVGSILAVDPAWLDRAPGASAFHPNAVLAPLPGPAVTVSAAAPDSLQLRRLLHSGLDQLGAPWAIGAPCRSGSPAPLMDAQNRRTP